MRPCRGFPRSMEGRGGEGNPFRGCPVIRGYIQERSREGWWCVTPPRGMNERNESGGRKESRRRASFRTVLEKVVWPYTFTDLHYPRLAPTLDTHHRPPQIVPLQRRVRGAAGRYTTSSVRPTKWHSPSLHLPAAPNRPYLLCSTKLCHGGAHISAEILLLGPDWIIARRSVRQYARVKTYK